MTYKEQVDYNRLPHHIAIIMDGNGRWANARGMERTMGHQEGAQNVHDIMTAATAMGIDYLTLYTFSTENWNRPEQEVSALMAILLQHLEEELFMKNNARFRTIGEIERLPQIVQDAIHHLVDVTSKNTGTCLVLALSYSSRWEMAQAVRKIRRDESQRHRRGHHRPAPGNAFHARTRTDDPYRRGTATEQLLAPTECLHRTLFHRYILA